MQNIKHETFNIKIKNMEQNPPQVTPSGSAANADNGKTVAIVSYLSIIGWVIAFVLHGNNKTPLGAYHLRQTITLFIVSMGIWILEMILAFIPYIGWALDILLIFVYIALFILWIIGFIGALNGEEKPMPVIGSKAQEWFKGIK